MGKRRRATAGKVDGPELVTKKEFAARIERTPARVSQLIKQGMPVRADGLIEPERASAWWQQHLSRESPRKSPATQKGTAAEEPQKITERVASNGQADPRARPAAVNGNGSEYAVARAEREKSQAGLKTLELRRRLGELVERADVEKGAGDTARRLRDSLLGVPDRIAAQVAAEKNTRIVHDMITAEIEKTLEALADDIGG